MYLEAMSGRLSSHIEINLDCLPHLRETERGSEPDLLILSIISNVDMCRGDP